MCRFFLSVKLIRGCVNARPDPQRAIFRLGWSHVVLPKSSPGVRPPAYEPTKYALSQKVLSVLMAMVRSMFGAPESEELKALRELAIEALAAESKKYT